MARSPLEKATTDRGGHERGETAACSGRGQSRRHRVREQDAGHRHHPSTPWALRPAPRRSTASRLAKSRRAPPLSAHGDRPPSRSGPHGLPGHDHRRAGLEVRGGFIAGGVRRSDVGSRCHQARPPPISGSGAAGTKNRTPGRASASARGTRSSPGAPHPCRTTTAHPRARPRACPIRGPRSARPTIAPRVTPWLSILLELQLDVPPARRQAGSHQKKPAARGGGILPQARLQGGGATQGERPQIRLRS